MTIPKDLIRLNLSLPPMLPQLIGVTSESRFFGLYCCGSKPYWSDGCSGATFSYYSAWEPFVQHPVVQWELHQIEEINLGNADFEATHQLLCEHVPVCQRHRGVRDKDQLSEDDSETALYVAPMTVAKRFLQDQHPKRTTEPRIVTQEEWTEIAKELSRKAQMPQLGMFDGPLFSQFRSTTPSIVGEELDMQWQKLELTRWLNDRVPAPMIRAYAKILNITEEQALELIKGQD